jgi:phosphatidylserine/phosphatidylglycerophosphate/cardiolipin synthase-like enzyme
MIIGPLITEPGDGLGQLKTQLQAATKSIDMTMYDFIDPEIEQILADKAAQTVLVRVILDHNREAKDNQPAFNFLKLTWRSGEMGAGPICRHTCKEHQHRRRDHSHHD